MPNFGYNPSVTAAAAITTHIEDVPHGTTPAEQTVLSDFETHLDPLERNPHGLTATDLDVYTKAQVDAMIPTVQVFNCGGFV